jgi:hypothetical protein
MVIIAHLTIKEQHRSRPHRRVARRRPMRGREHCPACHPALRGNSAQGLRVTGLLSKCLSATQRVKVACCGILELSTINILDHRRYNILYTYSSRINVAYQTHLTLRRRPTYWRTADLSARGAHRRAIGRFRSLKFIISPRWVSGIRIILL